MKANDKCGGPKCLGWRAEGVRHWVTVEARDEAVAAERARLIAELRAMHERLKWHHNYFEYAAQLLEGKE